MTLLKRNSNGTTRDRLGRLEGQMGIVILLAVGNFGAVMALGLGLIVERAFS